VFPEANAWWLAYVGLAPVLLLVAAAGGWREAVWRSCLGGTGFFVALHHWLLPNLGPFVVPAGLAMGATWIPVGIVAWSLLADVRTGRQAGAALAVVPAVWVLMEVVRSWHALGGSWGLLGLSQWRVRPMLALAALGGVWALSALLVLSNVALAVALRPGPRPATRATALGVAAGLVAATAVWGALRPEPPARGTVRIAGIQPGVVHGPAERLRANERLSDRIDPQTVDLVVWGQSSVGFDPDTDTEVRGRLEAVADRLGRDVLVNVDARRPNGRISKSAVMVRPGIGLDDTYVKQRLVPFGEYIPLRRVFGWVARFTEAANEDRVPGTDVTTMRSGELVFGPLISYESTFPDMRRAVARRGVELTLVQAASTTFQGSWAQPQQASFEAVRAVESGRPTVLVAVSGTSAAFDARGRRLAWVRSDEVGAWTVQVPLAGESTPYVRFGDWLPMASVIVLLAAGSLAARRRRGGYRWYRLQRQGTNTAP
jgi:apolipoprotein N-acyltransferase